MTIGFQQVVVSSGARVNRDWRRRMRQTSFSTFLSIARSAIEFQLKCRRLDVMKSIPFDSLPLFLLLAEVERSGRKLQWRNVKLLTLARSVEAFMSLLLRQQRNGARTGGG